MPGGEVVKAPEAGSIDGRCNGDVPVPPKMVPTQFMFPLHTRGYTPYLSI